MNCDKCPHGEEIARARELAARTDGTITTEEAQAIERARACCMRCNPDSATNKGACHVQANEFTISQALPEWRQAIHRQAIGTDPLLTNAPPGVADYLHRLVCEFAHLTPQQALLLHRLLNGRNLSDAGKDMGGLSRQAMHARYHAMVKAAPWTSAAYAFPSRTKPSEEKRAKRRAAIEKVRAEQMAELRRDPAWNEANELREKLKKLNADSEAIRQRLGELEPKLKANRLARNQAKREKRAREKAERLARHDATLQARAEKRRRREEQEAAERRAKS